MQKKWKVLLVAAVAVLTLGIGSGIALAQKSSVPATQAAQTDADAGAGCGGNGYWFDQVTLGRIATLLGTTTDQLQTRINNGQSLAEIASASGVSSDKLIDTILAPEQEHLAINVKYGYLTQQQADQALSQARTRLSAVITQKATAGTAGTARQRGPGNSGYSGMMGGGDGGMMGGGYGGMMGGSYGGNGSNGGMMGGGNGGMMGY